MKKILKDIFYDNKFELIKEEYEFTFFQKKNQEYFFIANYKEEELEGFFTNNKTNNIINIQENLNKSNEDINKNTSLVIYVKTNNLEEFFNKNKAFIYKIEEDEYYFRKYVIIYTENSIKEIKSSKFTSNKIKEILLKVGRMDTFEDIYYKDEEFYLVIQLYIKMSFLIYEIENKPFISLPKKIIEEITKEDLSYQYKSIMNWLNQESLILDDKTECQYFESLRASFFNIERDERNLLNFFDQLEETRSED